jgi:hypothetical protein
MCFLNLEYTYLEETEPKSTLKNLTCRKYLVQDVIVNRFSQGNNMLDAAASNIDDFLWRDTCVSLIQHNRPIGSKQTIYSSWKLWFKGNIHCKNQFNSHLETILLRLLLLTEMFFIGEICIFLQFGWIGLFGTKCAFLHLENYDFQEVFLSKTKSICTLKQGARWSCF